jgi:hypothetical protein
MLRHLDIVATAVKSLSLVSYIVYADWFATKYKNEYTIILMPVGASTEVLTLLLMD